MARIPAISISVLIIVDTDVYSGIKFSICAPSCFEVCRLSSCLLSSKMRSEVAELKFLCENSESSNKTH